MPKIQFIASAGTVLRHGKTATLGCFAEMRAVHWKLRGYHLRPTSMLRLTKKADYGLMALKYLAEHADKGAQSAKDISEAYHIPPQLLAKILQTLTRSGILVSTAGTYGGYALARPASDVNAFEVIRAIDGPLFITSCITIHGTCDLHGTLHHQRTVA